MTLFRKLKKSIQATAEFLIAWTNHSARMASNYGVHRKGNEKLHPKRMLQTAQLQCTINTLGTKQKWTEPQKHVISSDSWRNTTLALARSFIQCAQVNLRPCIINWAQNYCKANTAIICSLLQTHAVAGIKFALCSSTKNQSCFLIMPVQWNVCTRAANPICNKWGILDANWALFGICYFEGNFRDCIERTLELL